MEDNQLSSRRNTTPAQGSSLSPSTPKLQESLLIPGPNYQINREYIFVVVEKLSCSQIGIVLSNSSLICV